MAASSCSRVKRIEIDGQVVLKIIKHCRQESDDAAEVVQGVLLGLVDGTKLEITNCFPMRRPAAAGEEEEAFHQYQMDMMKSLRHVNVDHLHVGWYQTTVFASFLNRNLVDSQFGYQTKIEESVFLIYDPVKTTKGFLSLKAFRLSDEMMNLVQDGDFSQENLLANKLSFSQVLQEIPMTIKNSRLVNALLCEICPKTPDPNKYSFLDMATGSALETRLKLVMDSVDELSLDSNKYYNYQKQLTKVQQNKHAFQQKRELENQLRAKRGEAPTPEEDLNKLFRAPPPPSRLERLLLSSQVDVYCQELTDFASQSLGKLFMAESLHLPHSN